MKRILAERSVLGAFGATVVALVLLVGWSRTLQVGWLLLGTVALLAAGLLVARTWHRQWRPPVSLAGALILLLLGTGIATIYSWHFRRLEDSWETLTVRREAQLAAVLGARMDDVVRRGRLAAARAAELALAQADRPEPLELFRQLANVRDQHQVDAVAIYTEWGDLVAWSGQHRGVLPDSIWMVSAPAWYEERPLFSYLYFPVRVPARSEHVIVAVLVETSIITDDAQELGIGEVVEARTRTRASFRRGGSTDAVWSLVAGPDTVVHARLEPLSQAEWRARLERVARRLVLLAALAALVAFSIAWLTWTAGTRPAWAAALPLVLLLALAAMAPLHDALAAERLFSPVLFALPLRDMSLGRLLALLLPLIALVAGARRRAPAAGHLYLRVLLGAAVVAVTYPLLIRFLLDGATPLLLKGESAYWYGFQLALTLLLALITLVVLPRVAPEGADTQRLSGGESRWLLAAALALSLVAAIGMSTADNPDQPVRLLPAAFWAIPFVMGGAALAPTTGRTGALSRLLLAGWLASTAVLPHLWVAHVHGRVAEAESELESLGAPIDPFLRYLLLEFGNQALTRFHAFEEGVQLLYRTWVASGLAQQSTPVRIVLWSPPGLPTVQLGSAPLPQSVQEPWFHELMTEARTRSEPDLSAFEELPDLSLLLTVPLPDQSLITVMVPPTRTLERTSAIAPFLGSMAPVTTRLNLVQAAGPEPERESIAWERSSDGWRSEALVKYPDGWYHAHLVIALPPFGVRLARAVLLISFNLALLTLLWITGVVARGGAAIPRRTWSALRGSFRARITLALFAFFLVPTAVFGWVAYSALAGEVARAARTLARQLVAQAVLEFQEGAADLRDLASHAGTDVLRYINGELIDVSSREALDLGVYSAWLPPEIFLILDSGEEVEALETQQLGNHRYVTAYRTVQPAGTLGVPMSLSAGDTALRQRQFAHLVLFAVIVGALLSLALSVAVGRALAGPIGQLRRASAAVGAGRLGVRLPERTGGEFGQLFASFNRMTRRLRRARARELRTARVLAWGEMARQVAHEIKNPLTPIKLAVQHLRRAYADRHPQFPEVLESNVTQILNEIDRLSEIARAFSRYGAPALGSGPVVDVDAPGVIHEALTLYRTGDAAVRYIEDVQPDLPRVRARSDELKEVLFNLVENSRAALDGTGDIIISAYVHDGRVLIDVADSGRGIPPELLHRVFEPHFSTRSSGTGLGLAIVRHLVESWGGTVSAESEPGRGTVVRLQLLPFEYNDRAGNEHEPSDDPGTRSGDEPADEAG